MSCKEIFKTFKKRQFTMDLHSWEKSSESKRVVTKISKVIGAKKNNGESGWTRIKIRLGNNKNNKGEKYLGRL